MSGDHSENKETAPSAGCCGCIQNNPHRVEPLPGQNNGFELVEIRKGRRLAIHHINPSPKTPHKKKVYHNNGISWSRNRVGSATGSHNSSQVNQCTPPHVVPGSWDNNNPVKNGSYATSQNNGSSSSQRSLIRTATASSVQVFMNNQQSEKVQNNTYINRDPEVPVNGSLGESRTMIRNTNNADIGGQVPSSDLSQEKIFQNNPHAVPENSTKDFYVSPDHRVSPKQSPYRRPRVGSATTTRSMMETDAVVFFIHGVGGCADIWKSQMDYFGRKGYEIIAPDLIGHGFSCAPDDPSAYCFEEIAKDTLAIFDTYGKKRNVVVGHSYGSCFATAVARKRPRKVSKLILISGGGPTPLAPQPGVFTWPLCLLSCCRPVINSGFKQTAFHPKSKTLISKERAFDIPTYVLKYTMAGQQWDDGDVEYHRWLSVATLLIYGLQDQLVDLEEEQDMERVIYGSKLEVIDNASHMVMMEKPEDVNILIQDFLLRDFQILGTPSTHTAQEEERPMSARSVTSAKSHKSIPNFHLGSSVHLS